MSSNPLAREILAENYRNPANMGKPEHFTHSHELANRTCGDEITVYITLENEVVKQINYDVRACALCIAGASLLSQALVSKNTSEINSWEEKNVEELIGTELSINRVKCALLPLRALQQALGLRPAVSDF